MARLLESGETDRSQRPLDRLAVAAADAAEQALSSPQSHRDHVVDADRKAAVDVGDLRQVGDLLRLAALRSMRPASGLIAPTTPLNSVDFPAPLGPTTAVSEPASTAPSR